MPVSKVNSSGGQPEKLVTNRRIGHLILQMRVGRFSLLFLLAAISVFAQKYNPATWSLRLDPTAARPGSKVLARLDASKLDYAAAKDLHRTDRDFPVAWTKSYGKGRVFLSTFGHLPETWDNPAIQKMYFEAIRWTMRAKE